MSLLVLYGSSRRRGNSELLTDQLVTGLACTRIYLAEHLVMPIQDKRHTSEGFGPVDDDYEAIVDQVLAHDIIIFATPLYWYGMSAQLKAFLDRWSGSLRDQRFDFRADMAKKTAYVVVTGSAQPRIKALPLIQQFDLVCGYVGIPFAGYLIGEGNRPGDVLHDGRAMAEAEWLRRSLQEQMTGLPSPT
ncbi:MAG TPA: flavodoxin family protein [Symbiobacteriaceae bacterium]